MIHDRGVIADANEAFARMFGYELPELVGTSVERLATRSHGPTVAAHIASGSEKPYVAMGIRKDRSCFCCQLAGRPYLYKGKMQRIVILNDITERLATEGALRKSQEEFRSLYERSKRAEDLYRSLLHSSADAVVVYDLEGNAQYVNDSFFRIFGWTIDDLKDRPIPYVPDSEREATMTMIRGVVRDGVPCNRFRDQTLYQGRPPA